MMSTKTKHQSRPKFKIIQNSLKTINILWNFPEKEERGDLGYFYVLVKFEFGPSLKTYIEYF